MLRHREKVLAHAERQLVLKKKADGGELLALYKRFLKIEGHRLLLKHYAGGGGREVAQQRAELMDIVLRHLFDAACRTHGVSQPELAVIANGGYGRGELNPLSDVDIMFLHAESRKGVEPKINEVIQQILYMLWDVGFKVGHSTRSTSSAIQQANLDMLSKTSLLEARYVAGNKALFEHFKVEFEKKCVCGFEKNYIQDRVINQADRHEKYGTTVYLQEPNIKNGCGGLRDYQNMLWIAYFRERISSSSGLVERKLLTETERRKLDKAYDFLLRVRTELHYLNKRATDVLSMIYQPQIAEKFKYPEKDVLRRTEAFMRDYFQYARDIYRITEQASERLSVFVEAQPKKHRFMVLFKPKKTEIQKEVHFDRFYSIGDTLYPESRDIFSDDHFRLIRLFQHAQQRHLKLSSELQRLIQQRLRLVDRTFQYARSARETFAAILSRKGEVGRILRMMHEVDFLGRYIPEFGGLTCLVQHEFFHRYTADEHTLVCIEKLDALVDTPDPKLVDYRALFLKLDDAFVLYLALLLHDTGKAANVRYHAEASAMFAQRVAARHQLSSERRKQLIFLVDNHLLISSTAQRRNLEDLTTISEFASVVGDQSNLDALMILTLVDGLGVGSESGWSDWKESLVWHLYRSTTAYLEDSDAFLRERQLKRDELRMAVTRKLAKDFAGEIEAHFSYMPEIYFQTNSASSIISHLRLFRSFLEAQLDEGQNALSPAFKWVALPDKGHSEVWIVTWDRKQLFAKIAGSFAVEQLNILSADIYTRGDDLVLDLFRVCDTRFQAVEDLKVMERVQNNLRQALASEDYDFLPILQKAKKKQSFHLAQELEFPTRISVDNDAHPVYTLVDIQTPDRLGLLYQILRGFAEMEVDIALSRIATEKGAAIDSFYVTDSLGKKIKGADKIKALQKALQRATSEPVMARQPA